MIWLVRNILIPFKMQIYMHFLMWKVLNICIFEIICPRPVLRLHEGYLHEDTLISKKINYSCPTSQAFVTENFLQQADGDKLLFTLLDYQKYLIIYLDIVQFISQIINMSLYASYLCIMHPHPWLGTQAFVHLVPSNMSLTFKGHLRFLINNPCKTYPVLLEVLFPGIILDYAYLVLCGIPSTFSFWRYRYSNIISMNFISMWWH